MQLYANPSPSGSHSNPWLGERDPPSRREMKYQDSQIDSPDSGIYIIRLLSREQHSVLLFKNWIECVGLQFHFPDTFGIPHQVDPRKWDISATQAIQALKPGASCFSHESSIRTSNLESDESNVIWSHLAHPPCRHGGLILTTGQFFDQWSNVWDPPRKYLGRN